MAARDCGQLFEKTQEKRELQKSYTHRIPRSRCNPQLDVKMKFIVEKSLQRG